MNEGQAAARLALIQALDTAKAIYGEAMVRAGMLRGKVEEVHGHAEMIRVELEKENEASAS